MKAHKMSHLDSKVYDNNQGLTPVTEIMSNGLKNPQKGGMAAYDQVLGRKVMNEGYQLKGLQDRVSVDRHDAYDLLSSVS